MATYLQGVTDYIPQFQPFQPDLNFYNNVLQTKQTQYDSNYNSLNKIYGQYYYADLTHGDNVKRKEELLKNIDFNLKKVSGLDLSLEQNVTQATQVFKPFYEDKYLMKDMAYTKNYNNQLSRAQGLKNSDDEKQRAQYWEDGVAALNYQREEFAEADISDTLNFGNAEYTNYVNVQEKAMKLAKESELSIESVDFSPDGKWLVKTKNGEQLMEPLSKLFESQLGSDPAIQAVYKTQAYVNRKNYASSNAGQFGGDKNKAEMKYLETNFNMLKEAQQKRYKDLQEASTTYDSKIRDIQSRIDKGEKNPDLPKYLARLQEGKSVNQSVLDRIESDVKALEPESKTATTSTGFVNPYGDIKSLRWKVDSAMASQLMEKDLDESAQIFAFRNAKQDMEANPYAVNAQNHAFRMQEVASANASRERAARIRNAGEAKANMDKHMVESGAYHYDTNPNSPTYGQAVMNRAYQDTFVETKDTGSTGEVNLKDLSTQIGKRFTADYAVPYMQQSLAIIDKMVATGKMTKKEADHILSYNHKGTTTVGNFKARMDKDSYYFLSREVGDKGMGYIKKKLDYWVKNNKDLKEIADGVPGYAEASNNFNMYIGHVNAEENWRKETSTMVEQSLKAKGGDIGKYSKYLYDDKGRLRSEAEFYKIINKAAPNKQSFMQQAGIGKDNKWGAATGEGIQNVANMIGSPLAGMGIRAVGPQGVVKALSYLPGMETLGVVANAPAKGIYDDLVAAAGKAYASNKIKKAPPGISTMGNMNGAGLFTPGAQSIFVSPKAFDTKGYAYFHEFARDFRKLDFGDTDKNVITFMGPTATGMSKDYRRNDVGKQLVDAMIAEMNNSKSKFTNFKMSSQNIAAGNANTGAMILYPDAEWLANYKSTNKENNNNMLNSNQYNAIMKNGITVMSNSNNWTNGLFSSSYLDPVQAQVEYNGSYEYSDPYGNHTATVKKNTFGTGDYIIDQRWNILDHNTGEYIPGNSYENMSTLGNNLSQVVGTFPGFSEQVQQYNRGNYGY